MKVPLDLGYLPTAFSTTWRGGFVLKKKILSRSEDGDGAWTQAIFPSFNFYLLKEGNVLNSGEMLFWVGAVSEKARFLSPTS